MGTLYSPGVSEGLGKWFSLASNTLNAQGPDAMANWIAANGGGSSSRPPAAVPPPAAGNPNTPVTPWQFQPNPLDQAPNYNMGAPGTPNMGTASQWTVNPAMQPWMNRPTNPGMYTQMGQAAAQGQPPVGPPPAGPPQAAQSQPPAAQGQQDPIQRFRMMKDKWRELKEQMHTQKQTWRDSRPQRPEGDAGKGWGRSEAMNTWRDARPQMRDQWAQFMQMRGQQ